MADSLSDLLNGMGNTAPAIAAFLEGQGIRGVLKELYACPIAIYLRNQGCKNPAVTRTSISTDTESVRPPNAVRRFILLFDAGDFPQLVSPDLV